MKTYFAAFIPDGETETWSVLFADFELATQGNDLNTAFSAASEALSGRVKAMLEDGESLPEPSDAAHAGAAIAEWCKEEGLPLPEGTLLQLVPCDDETERLVRVNVSFPAHVLKRIDSKARAHGMTRSGFLAAAAQAYS
mgnify:FL=1